MSFTHKAVVGAFVSGGLLLFAVGLFLIGDRRLLFADSFELSTTFGRVTGLQVGTRVRVSGFEAGEVLAVLIPARPSEPFQVRMRLREDLRPLVRIDSISAIQTDGIVGNTFIQVSRGTDEAPVVEPGGTIRGQDPVEFADLIAEGRETFRTVSAQIIEVTDQVSEAVEPLVETAHTANQVLTAAGDDVARLTESGAAATEEARAILAGANGIVTDIRAGRGTIGQLLVDDGAYQRWVGIGREAELVVSNLRATTERARDLVDGLQAPDGAAQQVVQTMRDTLVDAREMMSDLSEGTEALKRNFLFRGFFRDRGFFDLDAVSRDEYLAGALEEGNRVALRIWIEADRLFAPDEEGIERLTPEGRRRLDVAMADLVRYARDSPLVVEGYAESADAQAPYLLSSDRATAVRDYIVGRFDRRLTLTGIMPMSGEAVDSPRGDRWSGVALALFVARDELGE